MCLFSRFPVGVVLLLSGIGACTAEGPGNQPQQVAIQSGPGELRPLSEVLTLARRVAAGKVIDVELESDVDLDDDEGQRAPRWVYEIEILTEDNRVVELEIDAVTGRLLEIDGAPWPADIPRDLP